MQRPAKPSPIGYSSVFYYAQFVFINSVIWLAVSVMELAQPLPYDLSELMNSTLFNRQEDQEICRRFQTGGMERLSEFASPFFPSKYPPNTECIRTIHAPPGYDIVFRFSDVFQIEASYEDSLNHPNAIAQHCPNDFLEIRDGRYSFSPLVGRFCGMRPPPEIRAQSGYAWLNFHSDGLIEERGFSAEYEFVRKWNQTNAVQTNDCHQSHVMHLDGYVNVSAVQLSYLVGPENNQQSVRESLKASTQTPRVQKHTTFAENGHVQRERAVNTSSPTEIWHTEESYSTRTPSVQMESLSIDTSLMTVNV
uniref:CUB domain-containing protein n=1 Tax=Bursaphelenchus xylophilus TaxID=6326 RepID=A0A1I7S191_BURXY